MIEPFVYNLFKTNTLSYWQHVIRGKGWVFFVGGGGFQLNYILLKKKYNKNIRKEGINKIKDDS